jgi:hypothetical protein
MQLSPNRTQFCRKTGASRSSHRFTGHWVRALTCIVAVVTLAGAAPSGQQVPSASPDRPALVPQANRIPDADDQMMTREPQTKEEKLEAANAEQRKRLADASAKLLTMAVALKVEVDKTNKDMLSLSVIRKAQEIEKLAHSVREEMKRTVGPS